MKAKAAFRSAPWALALAGWTVLAASSGPCASISGVVTADGKPLSGAWVQLNAGRVVSTDKRGRYSFTDTPVASYALQVFAAGRKPVVSAGIVPGKQGHDVILPPAEAPLGLLHIRVVRTDRGELCPARVSTRWRAAEADEWAAPPDREFASTLDAKGTPLVPQEMVAPWLGMGRACLWSGGEAIVALPPGQAEVTCGSGVLLAAGRQVVEVKAGETTPVEISLEPCGDVAAVGWTSGAIACGIASGTAEDTHAANLPLAAVICRAEGYDWVAAIPPYGNDPEQADPQKVAAELSDERFQLWLSPARRPDPWGGQAAAVGRWEPTTPERPAPVSFDGAAQEGAVLVPMHPFRSRGAGAFADIVLNPSAVPVLDLRASDTDGPEHFALWALLLGHGYRIGAAAVPGICLARGLLPVRERTFVRIEGNLSLRAVVDGLRRGCTAVSTGPVVSLAIGEALPGETLPAGEATHMAELRAWLADTPGSRLSQVQLVRGGEIVKRWDVSEAGPNHFEARIAIRESAPTWLALRATGIGGGLPRVAWTSPVYFEADGAVPPGAVDAHITGVVSDSLTGLPVAEARVTATPHSGAPVVATTRRDGSYELDAPACSMVQVAHPDYRVVDEPLSTADSTTGFVAWHCPPIRDLVDAAATQELLDWSLHGALAEAASSPTLDFALTPR